jgi:3D (Asp-Asp-Asp) domain-containing protein
MSTRAKLTVLAWIFLFLILALLKVDATTKTQLEHTTTTNLAVEDTEIVQPEEKEDWLLGEFTITYYCSCEKCCGKTDGITCSGEKVSEGITVAVDPNVIPLGVYIYIEGVGYRIAQDTGGNIKGKKVDVYMSSHEEALKAGIHKANVYVIEGTIARGGSTVE